MNGLLNNDMKWRDMDNKIKELFIYMEKCLGLYAKARYIYIYI